MHPRLCLAIVTMRMASAVPIPALDADAQDSSECMHKADARRASKHGFGPCQLPGRVYALFSGHA